MLWVDEANWFNNLYWSFVRPSQLACSHAAHKSHCRASHLAVHFFLQYPQTSTGLSNNCDSLSGDSSVSGFLRLDWPPLGVFVATWFIAASVWDSSDAISFQLALTNATTEKCIMKALHKCNNWPYVVPFYATVLRLLQSRHASQKVAGVGEVCGRNWRINRRKSSTERNKVCTIILTRYNVNLQW